MKTIFHLVAGLILGFSLASWAWSDTARATARNQVKALEQIEIARTLNRKCEAALLMGGRERWSNR